MGDLVFEFEGQAVPATQGDSIAAALAAARRPVLGARRSGALRGVYCGMGVCHDCLVTVDGMRGQRACMTKVQQSMIVRREAEGALSEGTQPPSAKESRRIDADIAIIGAGPAGLTAAIEAAGAGARVVVLDERDAAGGQYFKPRIPGFRGGHAPDKQHKQGDALRAQARASGARFLFGQSVWFARAKGMGFEVQSLGPDENIQVASKAVILATGAFERPAMVPGWTLPSVITIGAAQTLARRYGVAPGQRVLIASHGPLGLQLAAELVALGANVVALAERGRPRFGSALLRAVTVSPALTIAAARYRLATFRAKTPVLTGYELARVAYEDGVTRATLVNLATGVERPFDADIVAAGDGFSPQLELARLLGVPSSVDAARGDIRPQRESDGQTPVPGVWIAGDAGGLGGAEIAQCQGALSGASAAAYVGKSVSLNAAGLTRRLNRAMGFQDALWSLYRAPERALPNKDVVLCRCEEVTVCKVRAAIAAGAHDPSELKRKTRVGMGRCQGRYCLPQVMRLLASEGHPPSEQALSAPQIPARPVPLGQLALEKPEWGGHRQSAPAIRPARALPRPLERRSADLIVIGGGITGVSAALYAARAGASVVCLDRGRINGEASGGNAGSLHLQLLSWDFGGKAVGDGSLQLRTLPLQQESIALWRDLEAELGQDFEMQVTGGMMVAEDDAQIAFLEDKVKAEGRVGIHSEVIGADRVREIMPAVSPKIRAAAWCPGEGKINPLAATPPLASAARDAGAAIEEFAPVAGMARDGTGYEVETARGRIRAPRLLIAAGGWSCQIAEMLGARLPIRGAPLQMVVTAPGPKLVPCLLAHADRHITMKQAASGSIIIGGAWPAQTSAAGYSEILPESLEGNLWVAAHTVPQVASLHVIRSWAAMNIDIDGAPLIGSVPGLPGVSVAATANGYTLGPLMGREAAQAALSGRLRQDLDAFSMARFA
ncbi:MAG: FAD-dependent oxidoreductase [Pseudomonadota bacterium]